MSANAPGPRRRTQAASARGAGGGARPGQARRKAPGAAQRPPRAGSVTTAPPPPEAPRTGGAHHHPWPTRQKGPALAVAGAPLAISLFGVVLLVLGGAAIAPGAALVVAGLAIALISWRLGAPSSIATRLGGERVDREREARLVNLVEGLSVTAGLAVPEIRVIEDPARNLIVLGSQPSSVVLFCTRGLLEDLDRIELEGLLSHELAHIRRGDTGVAALATRACGLLAGFSSGAPRLVVRLAGSTREAYADFAGARITRYPPGLAAALTKLDAGPVRPAGIDRRTARLTAGLWCAPFEEARPKTPVAGLLSLSERAAALNEL